MTYKDAWSSDLKAKQKNKWFYIIVEGFFLVHRRKVGPGDGETIEQAEEKKWKEICC